MWTNTCIEELHMLSLYILNCLVLDGGSTECGVRRSCYSVQSPAGRGARWEWARFVSPPLGGELNYEPLAMEVNVTFCLKFIHIISRKHPTRT